MPVLVGTAGDLPASGPPGPGESSDEPADVCAVRHPASFEATGDQEGHDVVEEEIDAKHEPRRPVDHPDEEREEHDPQPDLVVREPDEIEPQHS